MFGRNFGVNLPGEMESFSKSALSMLPCHEMREDELSKGLGKQVTQLILRDKLKEDQEVTNKATAKER